MAVDVAPASLMRWPNAHIYIRDASLGHAGLDRTAHSLYIPWPGLTSVHKRNFEAAMINSSGATQLRLVAPSALAPSFSLAGRGHRFACLPVALPNYSFRAEWSKFIGGQARVCNGESTNLSNPP